MEFGNLDLGEQFKMSQNGLLIYEKESDTDAHCVGQQFSVQLGTDHIVYTQLE